MKNNQSRKNIPEGWQAMKLAGLFDFKNGLNKEKEFFGHGTPIINYMDINRGGGLYKDNVHGRVEVNKSEISRFNVKRGDVFFTRTSETLDEIGFSAVALDHFMDTVFSGFVLRARPKGELLVPEYAQYCFRAQSARKEIMEKSSYTTRALTSGTLLNHVSINIPNPPEQNRIVAVLETWDEAIQKLSQKIEKKKNIKKGLMQELLTGKKRLSGFKGKWEVQTISDVFTLKKGSELSKEKLDGLGNFECLLYGELYTTYDEVIGRIKSKTNVNEGTPSKVGDILIPASTTTGAIDLAIASSIYRDDVLLGGDINILRPKKKVDSRFFAYYLTHAKKHNLARLAQGVTIVHLYASDFKKIEIEVPEIEEQTAIADIITTAEKEISETKRKLLIIKDQKKYLLNNLITGTVRTPETLSTYN